MPQEPELLAQRRTNLDELVKLGVDIYPRSFSRTHTVNALVGAYAARTGPELEAERIETTTSGRVLAIRSFGKANFLVISDGRARIQVYLRQDSLPPRDFQVLKLLDIGDFVGVSGHLFRTKTNELTVWASALTFLSKCLIPMPEKWHGLQDI
jgi:lysyl-tRNA synthetase class 2